jgi:hypothetical protein
LPRHAGSTLCNILNEQEIKPQKVRYYLERRDPEFKRKMAEVLCVETLLALLPLPKPCAVCARITPTFTPACSSANAGMVEAGAEAPSF